MIGLVNAREHRRGRFRFPRASRGLANYTATMVEPNEVEALLRAAFPDASVLEVEDLTGTKDHYQATIVSTKFEGLSRVKQHQAVYQALGELMKGPIHALALNTYTPAGYAARPAP